jgi:hypothetical protein
MANSPEASPAGTPPARIYCSEHNDSEPMAGTADTVDVWLCLEYRPTWKARAQNDNSLSQETSAWLEQTLAGFQADGLKCRPQFIRQPETESESVRLLLSFGGQTYQFSDSGYDYLAALDLPGLVRAEKETPGALAAVAERLTEPQYLVCTNGQRDLCCARFGLPVYAGLKERVGTRAWQVTHLGGHRFAPNLLTLPDACLYGRVSAEDLDTFLTLTEQRTCAFTHLRGRTCYPPVVQAAEALLGRDGLRLLHVEELGDVTRVRFDDGAGTIAIDVRKAERAEQVLKSCGDEIQAEVFPYVRA